MLNRWLRTKQKQTEWKKKSHTNTRTCHTNNKRSRTNVRFEQSTQTQARTHTHTYIGMCTCVSASVFGSTLNRSNRCTHEWMNISNSVLRFKRFIAAHIFDIGFFFSSLDRFQTSKFTHEYKHTRAHARRQCSVRTSEPARVCKTGQWVSLCICRRLHKRNRDNREWNAHTRSLRLSDQFRLCGKLRNRLTSLYVFVCVWSHC